MGKLTSITGGKGAPPIGQEYKKFSVNYIFDDKNWSFDIYAKDLDEANKRVVNIKRLPIELAEIIEEL